MTDAQLAALCGMTAQNLRITYKKSKDPIKQRVYEFLRLGAEIWIEQNDKTQKSKDMLKFLKTMKPIEIEPIERRGRKIESFD